MLTDRQRLAAKSDALGMSRAEVAESAEVSEATIARWRSLPEYRAYVAEHRPADLASFSCFAPLALAAQRVAGRTTDASG